MTKKYLIIALKIYLLIGALIAFALKYAVPATNVYGWLYITLIWPIWLGQPLGYTVPVPYWMFSFD